MSENKIKEPLQQINDLKRKRDNATKRIRINSKESTR